MEKVYGIVKEIKGEYASVSIKRDSMCSDNCASCGLCSMRETVVTVKNPLNAKAGQKVAVTMESGGASCGLFGIRNARFVNTFWCNIVIIS